MDKPPFAARGVYRVIASGRPGLVVNQPPRAETWPRRYIAEHTDAQKRSNANPDSAQQAHVCRVTDADACNYKAIVQ